MKKVLIASAAVLAMTGASFAEATMAGKGPNGEVQTNSQGNHVSQYTSQVTGNGDWASRNGTGTGTWGAGDQTTGPGGRSATVQGVHAMDGLGRTNNTNNNGGHNHQR